MSGESDVRRPLGEARPALIDRIDHVALAVRSIEAVLPDFMNGLGLTLVWREELHDPPVRLAYLHAGNGFVQLAEPAGPGSIADFIAEHGEGLHHVCFAVADIIAARHAFDPDGDVRVFVGGRGRRACFLDARPGGLLVELTELDPFDPSAPDFPSTTVNSEREEGPW